MVREQVHALAVRALAEALVELGEEARRPCGRRPRADARARPAGRGRAGASPRTRPRARAPRPAPTLPRSRRAARRRASVVDCDPPSTWRSRRAAGRARNGPPRTWYGISASASASSHGSERALSRKRIATSSYGTPSAASARIRSTTKRGLLLPRRERAQRPARRRRADGAQRLRRAAEPRRQPVRELEDLRRRAVVLLERDDGRGGEARRAARAGTAATRP